MFATVWKIATSDWQCLPCAMGRIKPDSGYQVFSPRFEADAHANSPMKASTQSGSQSPGSTRECIDGINSPDTYGRCTALSRHTSSVSLPADSPVLLRGYYDQDTDAGSIASGSIDGDSQDSEYALQLGECRRMLDLAVEKERTASLGGPSAESTLASRFISLRNHGDSAVPHHDTSDNGFGDDKSEIESERIDRLYEEKDVAAKIRTLRDVARESPRLQLASASRNPGTTARINALAQKEDDMRAAMLRAHSPRDEHGCFRERMRKFREDIDKEQMNDLQVQDSYRTIMREKFERIGVKPGDIANFAGTSDAAETVCETLSQYHRHSMRISRYYPEPNQRDDASDMKQTKELDNMATVLESKQRTDASSAVPSEDVVSI